MQGDYKRAWNKHCCNVAVCVCVVITDKAAGQGHLDVIRFLLSNGANASLVDNADDTARDVAVRFRQLAAIRLLSPNTGTLLVLPPCLTYSHIALDCLHRLYARTGSSIGPAVFSFSALSLLRWLRLALSVT